MTLYRVVTYIFRPGEQPTFGLAPGYCIMSLRGCSGEDYANALLNKRVHKLKTVEPYFTETQVGNKVHELRKDDRDFQIGDVLELVLFVPEEPVVKMKKPCKTPFPHICQSLDCEGCPMDNGGDHECQAHRFACPALPKVPA